MIKVLIPKTEVHINDMRISSHVVRETYVDKMVKYQVLPIFASPVLTNRMLEELEAMSSGLLITGGLDIDPKIYGVKQRHPELRKVNPNQDRLDLRLFRNAYESGKPILGICRGHQVINVGLGGTLHQHIPDFSDVVHDDSDAGGNYDKVVDVRHPVEILKGTKLHQIMDGLDHVVVTSGHHQAVDTVGRDLRVSALAPDGVIEAIESTEPDRFCVGVQSHPEVEEESFFEPLFAAFAAAMTDYTADNQPFSPVG